MSTVKERKRVTRWVNPRCAECGLFTTWEADSYIVMGCANPDAPEPYDPEYLCPKCAEKERDSFVKSFLEKGLPSYESRMFYHSPRCFHEAKAIVRGMRKHGHPVPIRHHAVRYEFGYMRPEWEGKGTRIWCACGWNSGWVKGFHYENMRLVSAHAAGDGTHE